MLPAPRLVRFVFGALICCAALFQTGCAGTYTGGGWIDSVAGAPAKATFGFNLRGVDTNGDGIVDVVSGQFQYNDHGAGVVLHERPNGPGIFIGPGLGNAYFGPYSSHLGDGNMAVGILSDNDPWGNTINYLFLQVFDGPYAGYSNGGVVNGGTIQFHPPH